MLDHYLRAYKDTLLHPLTGCTGNISPNTITVLAAVVGVAAAGAAATSWYGPALGLWLANRVLDGLDGLVARRCNRQSDFGGYLDIVLDFVVYALVPIGVYWGMPTHAAAVSLIFLLGSFYVNSASWIYLAALLEKRQAGASVHGELTSVTMPVALIGGTETILFYCACLLWPAQLPWLFSLMAGLVLLGVGWRLKWAYANLGDTQSQATVGASRPEHAPQEEAAV